MLKIQTNHLLVRSLSAFISPLYFSLVSHLLMDRADPLPDDLVRAPVPADAAAVVTEGDVDHIHSLE